MHQSKGPLLLNTLPSWGMGHRNPRMHKTFLLDRKYFFIKTKITKTTKQKMSSKFFRQVCISIVVSLFYNCVETKHDSPSTQAGHIYFQSTHINLRESHEGPVTAMVIYSGPVLDRDLTINYTVSYPAENAAKEGGNFVLPANSGSFVLMAGQATTMVTLMESLVNDHLFTGPRSVTFNLAKPLGDFILGKPGQSGNKSVSVTITEDDLVMEKKFEMTIDGNTLKVPYYSNAAAIDQENLQVKRAVITMHGLDRNAFTYYDNMLAAAQMETTVMDTIMIMAPQFVTQEDLISNGLDDEHLYWSNGGWSIGNLSRNDATNPRPTRIPSFAVMDSLLTRMSQNLPNLKTLVFSGHSAGGQFANRYSASTPIVEWLSNRGIRIRFIVNNPSSYVYMDNRRRVSGTLNEFEVPTTDCITYNKYKYGLDDLPAYLNAIGATTIRERLSEREVVYLLGEMDNNANNSTLDITCDAQFQGQHRLERGAIYHNYLKEYYGTDITAIQTIDTVPGVGHDHAGMFQSELGRFYTFRKPLINE